MGKPSTFQERLWEQEAIGRERIEVEAETGGATFEYVFDRRPVGECIHTQVQNAGGFDKLLVLYFEQLRRAKQLVRYMDDNVGVGDQWPIYLEGDSICAEDRLADIVTELRNATNYLDELTEPSRPKSKG